MSCYQFNSEGFLEVQQIRKYELAYFYNRTPNGFRDELERAGIFIPGFKKRFYTTLDVQKIFNHFGPVSKADVENAQNRITEYRTAVKLRDIIKYSKNERRTDKDTTNDSTADADSNPQNEQGGQGKISQSNSENTLN